MRLPVHPGLRIGEVAKRTGLSVKTIRSTARKGSCDPSVARKGATACSMRTASRKMKTELACLLNTWQDCGGSKSAAEPA